METFKLIFRDAWSCRLCISSTAVATWRLLKLFLEMHGATVLTSNTAVVTWKLLKLCLEMYGATDYTSNTAGAA